MLTVPVDRLSVALLELDAGERALLDLSLRRGVPDDEIAELLRTEPAEVDRGREEVLALLAEVLEVEGADRTARIRLSLLSLPESAWAGRQGEVEEPDEPRPEPPPREPEPPSGRAERQARESQPPSGRAERQPRSADMFAGEVKPPPRTPHRHRRRRALLALTVLAAVAVVVALSTGGDDDPGGNADSGPGQAAPQGEPATAPLAKLGTGPGSGSVTVSGDRKRVQVSVEGLPPDGYEVWLYTSVVDAKSLGSFGGPNAELDGSLPGNARRYAFVDISREPGDGNPNHSGASVMRAPLADLLRD